MNATVFSFANLVSMISDYTSGKAYSDTSLPTADSNGNIYLSVTDIAKQSLSDIETAFANANGLSLLALLQEYDFPSSEFSINALNVCINTQSKSFIDINLTVSTSSPWTVISGVISIDSLSLTINYLNPFKQGMQSFQLSVDGHIDVDNGAVMLDVNATTPQMAFTAKLEAPSQVNLSSIINQLAPGLALPAESLTLSSLNLTANPKTKTYSVLVGISSWSLNSNITVDNLQLQLDYDSSTTPKLSYAFNGSFELLAADSDKHLPALALLINASDQDNNGGLLFNAELQIPENDTQGNVISGISLASLMSGLASLLGCDADIPAALGSDVEFSELQASFNTASKHFSFNANTKISTPASSVSCLFTIDLTATNGNYVKEFSGSLYLGGLAFDLIFQSDTSNTLMLASYSNAGGQNIALSSLLADISSDTTLTSFVSTALSDISFNLKDAIVVYNNNTASDNGSQIALGVDIGTGMDLNSLPLLGQVLPKQEQLKMSFHLMLADLGKGTSFDLSSAQTLTPKGFTLPASINQATSLDVIFWLGTQSFKLNYGFQAAYSNAKGASPTTPSQAITATGNSPATQTTTPAPNAASNNSGTQWFTLQKSLGPVTLNKVGIQFDTSNSTFYFLIDSNLAMAGLDVELNGLYASTTLNPITPSFGLHGLGINYQQGPIEIGGAFLGSGTDPVVYSGMANIATGAFSIGAIASYAYYNNQPSFFAYSVLDYPIGGPEFFFVTGLAAGFGINRTLNPPGINNVQSFPLVEQAVNGPPSFSTGADIASQVNTAIGSLNNTIVPQNGQYFLAGGIKFTSFDLLNGFVLVSVGFGNDLKITVLGLATLMLPPPDPEDESAASPIAEAQIALQATFNLNQGFLGVRAKLTPSSFLLDANCHLDGGFAFNLWFKGQNSGNYVITLGGYNPAYTVPSLYPHVDRVGVNWPLGDSIIIKGDAYFALVPNAVMAGINIDASWHGGPITAYINAGADFLLQWKPLYYNIEISANIGLIATVSFFGTHHIHVGLGASLQVWGPDFSIKVHVQYWIIGVTISFGSGQSEQPAPLTWGQFANSFLPPTTDRVNIRCESGMVSQNNLDTAANQKPDSQTAANWVVSPKDFMVTTTSAIPILNAQIVCNDKTVTQTLSKASDTIGIAIMDLADLDSAGSTLHSISILQDGVAISSTQLAEHFVIEPVYGNVPYTAWGNSNTPDINGPAMINNSCSGLSIKAVTPLAPILTQALARTELSYNKQVFSNNYQFASQTVFNPESSSYTNTFWQNFSDTDASKRNDFLSTIGINKASYINPDLTKQFVQNPQINTPA